MGKKSKKGVSRARTKQRPAAGQGLTRRKSSMSEDGGSRHSREDMSAAQSIESMPSLSTKPTKLSNILPTDVLLSDEKGDFNKENSVGMPSPLGNGDILTPTAAPAQVVAASIQDEEAKRKAIEKMVAEELAKRKAEEAKKKEDEAAAAKKKEKETPEVKNIVPPTQATATNSVSRNIEPTTERPATPQDEVFSSNLRKKIAEEEANAPAVLDVTFDEGDSPLKEIEKAPVVEYTARPEIVSRGLVDLSAPAPKESGMKQKDCACLIL